MSFGDAFGGLAKGFLGGAMMGSQLNDMKGILKKSTIAGNIGIEVPNFDIASKENQPTSLLGGESGSVSSNGGNWSHLASFFDFGGGN